MRQCKQRKSETNNSNSSIFFFKKKQNQTTQLKKSDNLNILQRRHKDGQQSHEKMLNIANYQRNENQNYNEVSTHTSENGHHQKVYK